VDRETVFPGESVSVALLFLSTWPVAPQVMAQVFVLGPQGSAVTALSGLTFSPAVGAETTRPVQWRMHKTAAPRQLRYPGVLLGPQHIRPGRPGHLPGARGGPERLHGPTPWTCRSGLLRLSALKRYLAADPGARQRRFDGLQYVLL